MNTAFVFSAAQADTVRGIAREIIETGASHIETLRGIFGDIAKPEPADYTTVFEAFSDEYVKLISPKYRSNAKYEGKSEEQLEAMAKQAARSKFSSVYAAAGYEPQRNRASAAVAAVATVSAPTVATKAPDADNGKDAALMLKAFIDALAAKKGKGKDQAAAHATALILLAKHIGSLIPMARQADTVAAMYATAEAAAEAAAEAKAADDARVLALAEEMVRERLAAMAGGGAVAAAMVSAASKPARKRKAG
jgi:hypothetical protein